MWKALAPGSAPSTRTQAETTAFCPYPPRPHPHPRIRVVFPETMAELEFQPKPMFSPFLSWSVAAELPRCLRQTD